MLNNRTLLAPLLVCGLLGLGACAPGTAPAPSPSAAASTPPAASPAPAASVAPTASAAPTLSEADEEGCEHMAEGPATALTAAATSGAGAPKVANDHKRYDITPAATGGFVKFESAEARPYQFYLSSTSGLSLKDAGGADVALTAAGAASLPCPEVKARFAANLGVGVYYLNLGQTTAPVSLVIEEAE